MKTIGAIRPERPGQWALAAGLLLAAGYAVMSLTLPFGWDHGIMAAVGSSYVHGKLPYVDSWDMKGPISYVPFALMERLFGPTMWGVRAFDVLISGGASFALYRALRSLTTPLVGAWAGLALYFWIASGGWFFTAAPDSWAASLCVLAVAPLLARSKPLTILALVISGVLIGCIGLIKPTFLVLGLAPLVSIALAPGLTLWRRAGLAIALGIGAALPIIITAAYFAALGGLQQAIEVHLVYALTTYSRLNTGTSALDGFAAFFARPTVALTVPFAALGAWDLRRRPATLWPTLAWLAAMTLSVAVQGKYYFYQWIPCYAPLVLLAAVGVHRLTLAGGREGLPLVAALAVSLTFAAEVCALPLHDAAKAAYYLVLKRAPGPYYATFSFTPDATPFNRTYNAGDEVAAAEYVKTHTRPDEGVFIWGNDATVQYLADRPNPTRFTFEMPLSLQGDVRARYREQVMRQLRANPPTYFILGINWWASDSKAQSLAKFPEMEAFLARNYRLEKSIGVLDLYRRNGEALSLAVQ